MLPVIPSNIFFPLSIFTVPEFTSSKVHEFVQLITIQLINFSQSSKITKNGSVLSCRSFYRIIIAKFNGRDHHHWCGNKFSHQEIPVSQVLRGVAFSRKLLISQFVLC